MGGIKTALLVLAAAALALFAWAFWKSRQPGSTGGVWGTIGGLWGGASNLVTDATEKTVDTFGIWGGGIKRGAQGTGSLVYSGVSGATSLVDDALHVGGSINPVNWF